MNKTSAKSIYQKNVKLEEQLSLWPFMKKKERNVFLQEIHAFVIVARETEQSSKTKKTKAQLLDIIEMWEEFLNDNQFTSAHAPAIISKFNKTSSAPSESTATESSLSDFVRSIWSSVGRLISQPLSPTKIDPSSPASIPRNPELRTIYEDFYGIVDAKGRGE